MATQTVHASITGRVQGVGFRAWVADEAGARSLSGWVRNRSDGSVEAVFAGAPEAISAMLEVCREGPPGSRVTEVLTSDAGETPEPGFRILPTA